MPIKDQPKSKSKNNAGAWSNLIPPEPGVTPGLESLAHMDKIYLKQHVDVLEAVTGFERKNQFKLFEPESGLLVGQFREKSSTLDRQFCKNRRKFKAVVHHLSKHDVLFKLDRPRKSDNPFCPESQCYCPALCCLEGTDSCGQFMTVKDNKDEEIGYIKQTATQSCQHNTHAILSHIIPYWVFIAMCYIDYEYSLYDKNNTLCYIFKKDICSTKFSCCQDVEIGIYDPQGSQVGKFVKEFKGKASEIFTTADNIRVYFPDNTTPEMKATIVGAVLLWDYNMWEKGD